MASKNLVQITEVLLQITPQELRFKFETRKNIPVTLSLHNPGSERVAFKVKTTSPKHYCVKPSSGFVEPGTTKDVQVVMQAQREAPQLGPSKDKFLVQCIRVPAEMTELPADAFDASKADPTKREGIQETKIRVTLVGPPKPPSPVPEGIEEEPSPVKSPFTSERGLDLPPVTPELPPMPQPAAASQPKSQIEPSWTKEPQAKLAETATAVQQKLQNSTVTSGGFTVIHLCIVALLAFLIGHYTS